MIKAIIVDDETSAVESLQWEITNFCSDVKIIDTFTNPSEAISAINYLKPDVVFLDIEMPELDGFQMLQKLQYKGFDLIITTAYNQYAIQAFKENAIDYLLKPVDPDDLLKAMKKVKKNRSSDQLGDSIEKVFKKVLAKEIQPIPQKIPLALQDKIVMVEKDDILYCKSDGNYTHVYLKNGSNYFISKSIKNVNNDLPQAQFLRIHKSYLVNTNYIAEYIRGDGGEVVLTTKKRIPVSRSHKSELLKALQIS